MMSSNIGRSSECMQQYVTSQRTGGQEYITTSTHGPVRRVTGPERVVGMTSRVDETRNHIIGERTVEHEVRVPRRIVHEEVFEKVVVIPEVIQREEVIEEVQIVREKIVEVAKPVIQEKIVEVPEYIYVDKIVEVPERILQEKIREVPRIEYQERIHEVPKIITQEKLVEVPNIEYHEYLVEKIVEVPEIHEQIVTKEIPITQYVDVSYPEYVNVDVPYEVQRNIPIPVEAVSTFEYKLPNFKSRVNKVQYPIYVPRFIEVPVAEELLSAGLVSNLNQNCAQVGLLAGLTQAVSLCEVENLATMVRSTDVESSLAAANLHEALRDAWANGHIRVSQASTNHNTSQRFHTSTHQRSVTPSRSRELSRSHSGRL